MTFCAFTQSPASDVAVVQRKRLCMFAHSIMGSTDPVHRSRGLLTSAQLLNELGLVVVATRRGTFLDAPDSYPCRFIIYQQQQRTLRFARPWGQSRGKPR